MDAATKLSLAVGVVGFLVGLYVTSRLKQQSPEREWTAIAIGALFFALSEALISVLWTIFVITLVPLAVWVLFSRLWPLVMRFIEDVEDGIDTFTTEAGISIRDARIGPQKVEVTEQLRDRLMFLDQQIEEARQVEGVAESDKQRVIAQFEEQKRFVQQSLWSLIQGGTTPR